MTLKANIVRGVVHNVTLMAHNVTLMACAGKTPFRKKVPHDNMAYREWDWLLLRWSGKGTVFIIV